MVQLSDDCFAFGDALLPLDQALSQLLSGARPLVESEIIPINKALGRVLVTPITAAIAVPGFDNSAVDGYAFCYADLMQSGETCLPISGRLPAGAVNPPALQPGSAARIFTGAPMPPGADTVMMQEDCRAESAEGKDVVFLAPGIKKGANTRKAGEDVKPGELILNAGRRLDPQSLGMLAAQGITEIEVYRALRVALLSTGNEIVSPASTSDPGTGLKTGQLFDANWPMLLGMLQVLGLEVLDLGVIEDDPATLTQALKKAAQRADVIVTSGGMSTGEEDHIRAVIQAEGRLDFWRLAIKPGRPVGFGWISRNASKGEQGRSALIGLPGNPVAAFTTFALLARPLLLKLSGVTDGYHPRRYKAALGFSCKKKSGRREFVRARIGSGDAQGRPVVQRYGKSGAAMLSSLVGADGFAEFAEDQTTLQEGDLVDFIPFSEILS